MRCPVCGSDVDVRTCGTCGWSWLAVEAEALFSSDRQPSDRPTGGQVRSAVVHKLRTVGERRCAEIVAQEFGDHPDTAPARMRWCRAAVESALAPAVV